MLYPLSYEGVDLVRGTAYRCGAQVGELGRGAVSRPLPRLRVSGAKAGNRVLTWLGWRSRDMGVVMDLLPRIRPLREGLVDAWAGWRERRRAARWDAAAPLLEITGACRVCERPLPRGAARASLTMLGFGVTAAICGRCRWLASPLEERGGSGPAAVDRSRSEATHAPRTNRTTGMVYGRDDDRWSDEHELLPEQTSDDTDAGWGEHGADDNLDRLLRERPPHHGG